MIINRCSLGKPCIDITGFCCFLGENLFHRPEQHPHDVNVCAMGVPPPGRLRDPMRWGLVCLSRSRRADVYVVPDAGIGDVRLSLPGYDNQLMLFGKTLY
jgi:hypothetical protein